jgi:hypothetical protein
MMNTPPPPKVEKKGAMDVDCVGFGDCFCPVENVREPVWGASGGS